MRYGLSFYNLGGWSDPRRVVELAVNAEEAGWDGVFPCDHLGFLWGGPASDAWTLLAAIAATTSRIRLGPMVTPLARRRPHVVAHAASTVDALSGGRFILGVGVGPVGEAGGIREFSAFGDDPDVNVRAKRLDEALEVVERLWSGASVDHHGTHFTVDGVVMAPRPVQRPRIPIWVGGYSSAARRRAARWDGWASENVADPDDLVRKLSGFNLSDRASPFDVSVGGRSTPSDRALLDDYAAAGATWWMEDVSALGPDEGSQFGLRTFEEARNRVLAGPVL